MVQIQIVLTIPEKGPADARMELNVLKREDANFREIRLAEVTEMLFREALKMVAEQYSPGMEITFEDIPHVEA